ncbi:toprim domain-containing protein [Actinomadura sp. NPDC047616]|uniref:toprim domain-containing protein n=1 Tax=Actinomadura sp. NPDC047616 TaxID=3155914 RepID=UPI0033DAEAAD
MTGPERPWPSVLRGIADAETARLRDGTLPWTWWLDRAVRHGRYGFANTLLIAAQWRAAADVRSYDEWRAAGRQVRKGETGIRIVSADGRVRAVFDIAQTDGLPPSPPAPGDGGERLAELAARHGLRPRLHPSLGGLDAATVLAHELAHAVRGDDHADCHGLRRVEADSVAYIVLSRLGLPPTRLRFPPAAPWAGATLGDRILRHARRLLADHDIAPLLAEAHAFFLSRLPGSWVPDYLAGRGFPPDVRRRRQIGYAPPGPRALTCRLRSLGHDDAAILASGLARPGRDGGPYDTFRDRAVFPLRAADGTIAGFIGRARDGAPGPKYLNGPDTALFHKGELLYGLHEARARLARGARPVIVEGPLDAIAVDMSTGDDHAALALCAGSLTSAQLDALRRAADLDGAGLLLALDGDRAGRSAAQRVWRLLAGVRGPVDVAVLPAGRDPADVLREHGPGAVAEVLRGAVPLPDVVVDAAMERAGGRLATCEHRLAAIRAAARVIAAGRPDDAARQVVRVAHRTGVAPATVTEALCAAVGPGTPGTAPPRRTTRARHRPVR